MARTKDRSHVLTLRKQGMSYSQIKTITGICKGTLSAWLHDLPLSKERISELRDRSAQRIEKFRATMQAKQKAQLAIIYQKEKERILPLSKKELFLAGLLLYWAEGTKNPKRGLNFSNSNPAMIKFFLRWVQEILRIPISSYKILLHLYNDMNMNDEIQYWSNILQIPRENFSKPYIKPTTRDKITYKGTFTHGTCNVRIGSVVLAKKTLMGIQVIADSMGRGQWRNG